MSIFSLLMKVSEPKYCQLCEINVTSEISLLEFSSTANNMIHGENLIAGKLNPDLTHCHIYIYG